MVKTPKMRQMPVQGGIRRNRGVVPRMQGGSDATTVSYNAAGSVLSSSATGEVRSARSYIVGNSNGLSSLIGPDICAQYSSGKFLPGTKVRWEPSVSFNTTGRIFVGFTDNPEVVDATGGLTNAQIATFVRSLGNVISFPVWQETEIPFPTKLRRKRFDTNSTVVSTVDVLDRCMQTFMFIWIEGMPASTTAGSFWYHDRVDVEGLHNIVT